MEDHNCQMVVIGQRGLGTFRRTFLGSVSDYIIHHTKVPTIVVPQSEKWVEKNKIHLLCPTHLWLIMVFIIFMIYWQ